MLAALGQRSCPHRASWSVGRICRWTTWQSSAAGGGHAYLPWRCLVTFWFLMRMRRVFVSGALRFPTVKWRVFFGLPLGACALSTDANFTADGEVGSPLVLTSYIKSNHQTSVEFAWSSNIAPQCRQRQSNTRKQTHNKYTCRVLLYVQVGRQPSQGWNNLTVHHPYPFYQAWLAEAVKITISITFQNAPSMAIHPCMVPQFLLKQDFSLHMVPNYKLRWHQSTGPVLVCKLSREISSSDQQVAVIDAVMLSSNR